ncbi:DUF1636 family protein [Sedimentitalea sp. JM2-8]|uniref:DUF1636 family protein n=1 Tax=Sedimentitalea xiamensis TaxID=3050037 RepID=A0ABT7FH96_9RHOB|nr:DUF1636 family protein [Sedimentitalea xiamensis]MDK3074507.1 DUF1636 family protein [Sedimentitalea xiamensis]
MANRVALWLCANCERSADWSSLRRLLAEADLPAQVRLEARGCMNGCADPVALAIQSAGRATYFFTGIAPEEDASDIVATLRCYLAAPDGWIDDARPCGRLRHCLKGRVPAL